MKITWIGHSCFRLENKGYVIVTDPYAPGSVPGLSPAAETADQVFCSHEHGDHGYRAGVTLTGRPASQELKVTEIAAWHDPQKGALRGPKTIRMFDFGTEKAVHLGDLGGEIEPEQKELLKNADVLMIPVGGHFTIDAGQAAALTRELQPKMVIPMHYRDDEKGFGYSVIGRVQEFTDRMENGINGSECEISYTGCRIDTADYHLTKGKMQIVVMTPQNL